jgi:hypothetical protein
MSLVTRVLRRFTEAAILFLNQLINNPDPMPNPMQEKLAAFFEQLRERLRAEVQEIYQKGQQGAAFDFDTFAARVFTEVGQASETLDAPPAEGKHNVNFAILSGGRETFNIRGEDLNCDDFQAQNLDNLIIGSANAALGVRGIGAPGAAFPTEITISDNGASKTVSLQNAREKATFDIAIGEAIAANGRAQIAAIDNATPPPPA